MYKVSVGIPVYNAEKYILRCLSSIVGQTYGNIELVIVDDCSADNSLELIRQFISEQSPAWRLRIKLIAHEKNQGVSTSRNDLLANFTGEFFSFVDADDYLTPIAIEKLVDKQLSVDYDMVSGKIEKNDGTIIEVWEDPVYKDSDEFLLGIIGKEPHENVARIYRFSIIKEHNIRYVSDIKIGEDWLFLVEFANVAKSVSKIDEIVYVYDYTNQESAMHKLLNSGTELMLIVEDVVVLKLIEDRIQEKEDIFKRLLASRLVERIYKGLKISEATNNGDVFQYLFNVLSTVDFRFLDKNNRLLKIYRRCFGSLRLIKCYLFLSRMKGSLALL